MDSIVTLTMNPALDITVAAEAVRPTSKIRCSRARYDAGGGGIFVRSGDASRADRSKLMQTGTFVKFAVAGRRELHVIARDEHFRAIERRRTSRSCT